MRQLILSILFIIHGLSAIAQDHEATMYFTDGTDVAGFASIKFIKESFYGMPKDKISFRVSEDDEAELWDEETVAKIVFHDMGAPVTFEYINVTYVDGIQASLFQVIEPGEITLYAEAVTVWDTKNNKIIPPMPKNIKVKRAIEKDFAILSNKKKITAYFNCKGINDRLESGEFNSHTLVEMVNYYNENCAVNTSEQK